MCPISCKAWKIQDSVKYLNTAAKINQAYYFDKFLGLTIEGVQRVGKTSYSCKCLAQACGEWRMLPDKTLECVKPNYEEVKKWIVFLPKEFLGLVLTYNDEKQRAVIWDDAGFWLFALDWYEPFVKSVSRYAQLCGTQFACLIMTTPDKRLISQKVLDSLPKMKICEVTENGKDTYKSRPRVARVYERWNWVDGKRGGVKKKWIDRFNAMLPDDFYNWYYPKRRSYLEEGKKILQREVLRLDRKTTGSKKEEEEIMETVHKVVGDPDRLKEVNEVLAMLEQDLNGKKSK